MTEITDHDQLITVAEFCEMARISKSTVWDGVRKGHIPQPIRFGPRTARWRLSDVRAWMAKAEAAA